MSLIPFSNPAFSKSAFLKPAFRKPAFQRAAYPKRIGYQGSLVPDIQTLRALHRAHLHSVPFENLDIHLDRPIVLDEARFFEKIVNRRRGGLCYELNGLFAALLQDLGFKVHHLAARVANGSGGYGTPFNHMTLLVELNERWLADVSFGNLFHEPLRLDESGEQVQSTGRYRIDEGGDGLILLKDGEEGWTPHFTFSLQRFELRDFTAGCQRAQTSPESCFTQRRICSLVTPLGRILLSDRKLIVIKNGLRQERLLQSECEVYAALRDLFGIELQERFISR